VTRAIAALADEALEAVTEAWLVELRAGGADVDPFELSTLLGDLRDGARAGDPTRDQLFALLEERVL
jgi:hypothetical protein